MDGSRGIIVKACVRRLVVKHWDKQYTLNFGEITLLKAKVSPGLKYLDQAGGTLFVCRSLTRPDPHNHNM